LYIVLQLFIHVFIPFSAGGVCGDSLCGEREAPEQRTRNTQPQGTLKSELSIHN
jgi:hypothetical protein